MMAGQQLQALSPAAWRAANAEVLALAIRRLQLMIERRVLWLRAEWAEHRPEPRPELDALVIRDSAVDQVLGPPVFPNLAAFMEADARARRLSEEIDAVEARIGSISGDLSTAGRPPALQVLVRLFGLNRFERDTLLLCAALEQDASFGRLYAYVQDDATLRHPTPQLAMQLFCPEAAEPGDALKSFGPEAPLRRFQLVTPQPGTPPAPLAATPLKTDARILEYLSGFNRLDERASILLSAVPAAPLAPAHEQLIAELAGAFKNGGRVLLRHPVNLFGAKGAGHTAVARGLAARLGLHLYRLDPARLPPAGPERVETLRLLAREAMLCHLALFFEAENSESETAARDAAERLPVFFIVASPLRLRTERPLIAAELPALDSSGRQTLWEGALHLAGIEDCSVEAIVQQFDFGPETIARIVAAAQTRVRRVRQEDLWEACRQHTSSRLSELAQAVRSPYGWDDIVLPREIEEQLREIAGQVTGRARVYREWGFERKLSRGHGISAMFSGVSGTGKTMAAEVLANHLALDLYRVDLAGVVSKYIGETEKNLARIFEAAENSGAILFFDEADALFGRRTEVKDSHDRFANIEINYLLQRMEDYRGLSILATNRKTEIDRAFLRRIRFLVEFPFPDAGQRLRIWQKVLPAETPTSGLDYDLLSLMEIPGGNIRNIALSAAFLAAAAPEPLTLEHIVRAAKREYAKIDKLISDTPFYREFQKRSRQR